MKKIALFGSTGSIGVQTLEIIDQLPEEFKVTVLTAKSKNILLVEQARKFQPKYVVIVDDAKYEEVKKALSHLKKTKVLSGKESLMEVAKDTENYDIMLAAMVGISGLPTVFEAVKKKKKIALANKEVMVVLGHIFSEYVKKKPTNFLPVDSEHSAIFQCLQGEQNKSISKVVLTASGGAFRGKKKNLLQHVVAQNALTNPNWTMGKKVTIDSSTLMNKGLEMIEAKWLFSLQNEQIDVVVHPQSIIHSMVEFIDGSVKAQLSIPDMKMSILYALSYPKRLAFKSPKLDLIMQGQLDFEACDYKTFDCISLAREAMIKGGNYPCVLNAANEVAVHLFLNKKIKFLQIPEIIAKRLEHNTFIKHPSYEQVLEQDMEVKKRILFEYSS